MLSNIIIPLPKKSDTSSKTVRKVSGDLDDIKKALVATIGTVFKEGNTDTVDKKMKTKRNVVWKSITSTISAKKKIDAVKKTKKSQASNKTVGASKSNKTDTVKYIYINQGLIKELTQLTQ